MVYEKLENELNIFLLLIKTKILRIQFYLDQNC